MCQHNHAQSRGGALEDYHAQETSTLSQPNLKNLFILLIAVDLVVVVGASLWLGAPDSGGCACPALWLNIYHVAIGHDGSATFSLRNYGTFDYTITQASVVGPGIENEVIVNVSSGNVVSFKNSLNLTVIFPNVVWQHGGLYGFILTDSQGEHFVVNAIA